LEHRGVGPYRLGGVVVRHDEEDVGPLISCPAHKNGEGEDREDEGALVHESFLDRKLKKQAASPAVLSTNLDQVLAVLKPIPGVRQEASVEGCPRMGTSSPQQISALG
ncbi:MAG: hypothetical protein CMO35_00110, partial [Verrucomicrobiaceae bacterium]|nr:hypothetical protein [Verrucomicrobiaceae bacterium]